MSTSIYTSPEILETFSLASHESPAELTIPGRGTVQITKPFPSPAEWRDKIIYLAMIDRFNNPKAPPPVDWNRKRPGDNERFGGTFEGIRQRLDYLQQLGVGALWLTPVLKNRMHPFGTSHHGYGIYDFTAIDDRFASDPSVPGLAEKELIRLIDEAHARDIHVILDIVINHAGDVFEYAVGGATQNQMPWSNREYDVRWREGQSGAPRPDWATPPEQGTDVGPVELLKNDYFRRHGAGGFADWEKEGDFCTLKEFNTEFEDGFHDRPLWSVLIRAYQYLIAKTDADGFRLDTIKFVPEEFAKTFCNAIREYAASIGKKNFFMFGEAKTGDESVLASYTGRNTSDSASEMVGADAQIDFPLQWKLTSVTKGFESPVGLMELFQKRKKAQEHVLSTHGEASKFFVSLLDGHDDEHRYLYPRDGKNYEDQLALALGCLFTLQGIPCVYYGTEAGLKGTEEIYAPDYNGQGCPEYVREALWGKPGAFSTNGYIFQQIQAMAAVRADHPALRYGRQYFREVSGNARDFGYSKEVPGIIAFSRILNDREVVVVANTSSAQFVGEVLIDDRINARIDSFDIVYSNKAKTGSSGVNRGSVRFYNLDNSFRSESYACRLSLALAPQEIQIFAQNV